MTYYLYVDQIFLENFFYDFLIILGAARLISAALQLWRLCLAAAIGGIYGVLSLLPQLSWLGSWLVVLLLPLLLLFITIGRQEWGKTVRAVLYYYLLAFALNGVIAACGTLFRSLPQGGIVWFGYLLSLCMIVLIVLLGRDCFRRLVSKDACFVRGRLSWRGREASLGIFLDTGNSLSDSLSGLPVMVAEYRALRGLLPEELCLEYEAAQKRGQDTAALLASLNEKYPEAPWLRRLSLLPFRSVGERRGLLPGFRPEALQVGERRISLVVAIYDGRLGGKRGFQAIFNPWALLAAEEKNQKRGVHYEGEGKIRAAR